MFDKVVLDVLITKIYALLNIIALKNKNEREVKKMKARLTGIVSRKKEDGKVSTMLYVDQIGFNAYESDATICKGYKTAEIYYNKPVEAEPGDILQIDYEPGYQGRAQVSEISVIQRKK